MFDFVRRHNRLMQFGLAVLIVPSFVAFGIQGYQRFQEGGSAVAHVAGRPITQAEWDAAHRQQAERMRNQVPNLDPKMLDTPQFKQRVLEELVRDRVTAEAALELKLAPGDERLQRLFRTDPQFASLRNADGTVKRELLEMQGMSSEMFAARLRQDLAQRQVQQGVLGSGFVSQAVANTAVEAYYQQREVRIARFEPQNYLAKLAVTEAQLQAYYDDPKHAGEFQSPESASVEYLVLDLATAMASVTVPEDDLRKYYSENQARYEQPSERRARHILFKTDAGATDEAKAKAKSQAEAVLAALRRAPATFAEVAKQQSQDPGSAAQGGDLGWFGKGAMTPKFEDAVFALKKGELSGVVETEFGYHLIELTELRGGDKRPYEQVKTEIEAEVKKQLAQKRYAELAEQFTNLVEQEDSLQPVADKLKLTLRKNDRLLRATVADPTNPLTSSKVVEAVFQPETLRGKRNTEPLEAGANQLVSVHVVQHSPARRLPLADVKEALQQAVKAEQAAAAARKEGEARLAEWKAAPDAAALPDPVALSRSQSQKLPKAVIDAVLKAPAESLPAWIGIDLGRDGYVVAKVQKVLAADPAATGDLSRVRATYAQLWSQAEGEAYYAALKTRFKTEINAKIKAAAATTAPQ